MKRDATDILRRGLDNVIANWPLILIHLAAGVIVVGICVAAVIAIIVPVAVSAGVHGFSDLNAENVSTFVMSLLREHWMMLLYILGAVCVVGTVWLIIHSMTSAGAAQVYVDAERAAHDEPAPPRERFAVFSAERWWAGVRRNTWTIFWIFNVAWLVAGLIILAPLLVVSLAMLAMGNSALPLAIGMGCLGLLVTVALLFIVGTVTTICVTKATVVAVARGIGAADALRAAWQDVRVDFGRQLAVTVVLMAVSFGGSLALGSIGPHVNFGTHDVQQALTWALLFSPVQLVTTIIGSAFTAGMSGWFLASFASIATEHS